MRVCTAVPALLLLLASCSSPTAPGAEVTSRSFPDGTVEERRVATIEYYGDPVQIDLPSEVKRGQSFAVRVRTYGGGCIAKGDTEVQMLGNLKAQILPYDWEVVELPPNTACTLQLSYYSHEVLLRFEQSGVAQITVRGRRKPSGEILTTTRSLRVR